jgi:hypothetical protein
MTLGASTFADAIGGGWAQGCLVLLIFSWLFLALLGIRNARFPKRLIGGAAFIVGSALWIGLHPALAEAWHLDSGDLGWMARISIADRLSSSAFALNAIGALLLLCSLIGFLIAIDWLPLLPLAPMLARLDERMGLAGAPSSGAATQTTKSGARSLTWLRSAAAATLERAPKPRLASPPSATSVPSTPAPSATSGAASPTAPASLPSEPSPSVVVESAAAAVAESAPSQHESIVQEAAASDDSPPQRDWARFRPRARPATPERSEDDLTVDIASDASHNSSAPEGASRAPATVAEPSGTITPEGKDPPVLDPDHTEEHPLELAAVASRVGGSATSVADDEEVDAESEELAELESQTAKSQDAAPEATESETRETAETTAAEQELAETLSPKRKKEEPEEEPAEEPGEGDDEEEDDEEGGEEEDEDFDEEEDEEEEEEEFEEDEDEDEDWEEEDEEEKEEEEEGEDEDEEKKEDDEEWDDDEEEDDDEDDKEDDEEEDEEEKDWDDDKGEASAGPIASAEPAILEVDAVVAPEVPAELVVVPEAPAEPVVAPSAATDLALPKNLFPDLPDEERQHVASAVESILGLESVSLSRIQRELGITYYAAARVFERLEKEGFIAPYSGSLARSVLVTREQWEERRRPTS